jgi:hypothetical protein
MYRIVLVCRGVPKDAGANAACAIREEFVNRPWHQNVLCAWDGSALTLQAENEYDANGQALTDEFSDALSACIEEPFDGDIDVISITTF